MAHRIRIADDLAMSQNLYTFSVAPSVIDWGLEDNLLLLPSLDGDQVIQMPAYDGRQRSMIWRLVSKKSHENGLIKELSERRYWVSDQNYYLQIEPTYSGAGTGSGSTWTDDGDPGWPTDQFAQGFKLVTAGTDEFVILANDNRTLTVALNGGSLPSSASYVIINSSRDYLGSALPQKVRILEVKAKDPFPKSGDIVYQDFTVTFLKVE